MMIVIIIITIIRIINNNNDRLYDNGIIIRKNRAKILSTSSLM